MNRRKLTIFGLVSLIGVSLAGTVASSIAWFHEVTNLSPDVVTGSVQGAYYAGGDGTSGNPYQIHDPIHLYNLAWLQYFGTYNKFSNNALTSQTYFVVTADLDMTGWTLPPIGTEDYPFLGKFDGGGHTIKGLTSTNEFGTGSGVKTPPLFTGFGNTFHQPQIVGFFGVVGKLPDDTYTYTSENNQMINYTLDGTKVESRTSQTLIGIAAGYVNATMNGVKVNGAATIDVNGTTASTAVDSANITKNLSDYGLVGFTANTNSGGDYSQKLSEFYFKKGTTGGQGQGDDWGGSINIKELNVRLYNMLNVTTNNGIATDDPATHHPTQNGNNQVTTITVGKTFLSKDSYSYNKANTINNHRYYSDDYNKVSIATYGTNYSSNSHMNLSPLTNSNLYCFEDSQTQTATHRTAYGSASTTTFKTALPGTILPLNVDTKANGYQTYHSVEKGLNTGYIIGGQTSNSRSAGNTNQSNYYYTTTVRTASSAIKMVECSINSQSTFDNSRLEILSNLTKKYDTSKTAKANFGRIEDSYNKANVSVHASMAGITSGREIQREISENSFNSYKGARRTLGGDVLNGASLIHGLHFLNGLVDASKKETANNIFINSTTPLNNYELPRSALDFHLKSKGYISFFAGSYQNAIAQCDGFFSLYTVSRTTTASGSTINSIKEIDKIYNNPDGETKAEYPYVYLLKDGTYTTGNSTLSLSAAQISGLELQFDCEFIRRDPPLDSAIYYFEIPANKGEHVIGNANNGTATGAAQGAYLMYLDIQAAAAEPEDEVTAYSVNTLKTGCTFPTGVDFAPVEVSGDGGESIGVYIASGNSGIITFEVTTANIAITDDDAISAYSFQGSQYFSGISPPGGKFTVSGDEIGDLDAPPEAGTRELTIKLETTTGDKYTFKILDELAVDNNTVVISSSTFTYSQYNNETRTWSSFAGVPGANDAAKIDWIQAKSDDVTVDALRALTVVATLQRETGDGEFVVSYDEVNSNYNDKIVDVDIDLFGTTISIEIEDADYTFKIGGTEYGNGETYPSVP